MIKIRKISFVIASVGRASLINTVNALLGAVDREAEIICIFPPGCQFQWEPKQSERISIKIFIGPRRGQVRQRVYGIRKATGDYVIQMDDDQLINHRSLTDLLVYAETLGPGNVIAPWQIPCDFNANEVGFEKSMSNAVRNFKHWICGARLGAAKAGQLTKAGVGYWFPKRDDLPAIVETEWLPGGMVGSFRNDTNQYDYYPFSGRAYSEDLIQSWLWREKGCRLHLITTCSVENKSECVKLCMSDIIGEYRAKGYLVGLMGGSRFRLLAWFVLSFLGQQLRRINSCR